MCGALPVALESERRHEALKQKEQEHSSSTSNLQRQRQEACSRLVDVIRSAHQLYKVLYVLEGGDFTRSLVICRMFFATIHLCKRVRLELVLWLDSTFGSTCR